MLFGSFIIIEIVIHNPSTAFEKEFAQKKMKILQNLQVTVIFCCYY